MGIEIVKEICVGASKHGRWGRCEAFPVISAPAVSLIALPGYTLTTCLAHHTGGVLYTNTNTNTNTNTITNTNININTNTIKILTEIQLKKVANNVANMIHPY